MNEIINNYKKAHPKAEPPENFFSTFGAIEVLEMIEAPERKGRAIVWVQENENINDGGFLQYEEK